MTRAPSVVLVVVLVACGGGAAESVAPRGTVRADLVCTETEQGQAACEARGCQWGPPLFCSGIQQETDAYTRDATRPCVCTCEADMMECMSRP